MEIKYTLSELTTIIAEKNQIPKGNYDVSVGSQGKDRDAVYTFTFIKNKKRT